MQNFSDWLIVGSLTLVVGATASFAIPGGGASGALLGSTTGAVLGAAISSKRQDDKQRETVTRLKELENYSLSPMLQLANAALASIIYMSADRTVSVTSRNSESCLSGNLQ